VRHRSPTSPLTYLANMIENVFVAAPGFDSVSPALRRDAGSAEDARRPRRISWTHQAHPVTTLSQLGSRYYMAEQTLMLMTMSYWPWLSAQENAQCDGPR
jgi:hypothetical protein